MTIDSLAQSPSLNSPFPLPDELTLDILKRIEVPNLLAMQEVCQWAKGFVGNTQVLQSRIAFCFTQKMIDEWNIPYAAFECHLIKDRFCVEIKDQLTLWKFTHVHASVDRILPCICQLTVKEVVSEVLDDLISKLQNSSRLTHLFLPNAEIKPSLTEALPKVEIATIPINFPDLKELSRLVKDESTSAEAIIEKIKAIECKNEIIASIWHSALMPADEDPKPRDFIEKKVWEFITENPHHEAVRAAIFAQQQSS